jgi:ribosomal protein S18 acetylase RimI-like enzyme
MEVRCISSATLADDVRADLARLLAELDPSNPPRPANLEALLEDGSAWLIRATNDSAAEALPAPGACIGMLTLTLRNSLTRRSAHVDHVVVDAAHRRAGIGKRLVEAALRLAAAEGASRVDLSSSPDRAEAQALYRSLGFEQRRTVHWRRPL